MTDDVTPRDLRQEVESYLARSGWTAGGRGEFGELWESQRDEQRARIAVPYRLVRGTREFESVVRRLAGHESRTDLAVADALEHEFVDVQSLRISDRFVEDDSVRLESAATVLSNARRLVRAAATSARKPRAHIGANYSPPADEIAAKARLSHTRRGSFVLPIVMPLEKPQILQGVQMLDRTTNIEIESAERRVTRTLATALTALDRLAVRPDREASTDDVLQLITTGVSKELVAAVRAIATDGGVHAFESAFQWAPGVTAPANLPERVVIPSDAAPLLGRLERTLAASKPSAEESISGQIVEIRHLPDESFGQVSIRARRGSRETEIKVTAREDVVREAADWFKAGRVVMAVGKILSVPGRPLSMPEPKSLMPLDRVMLDSPTQ